MQPLPKIGYLYDPEMVLHRRYEGNYDKGLYDEIPERITVIDMALWDHNLYEWFEMPQLMPATDDHLRLVHTQELIDTIKEFWNLPRGVNTYTFTPKGEENEATYENLWTDHCAWLAAGAMI